MRARAAGLLVAHTHALPESPGGPRVPAVRTGLHRSLRFALSPSYDIWMHREPLQHSNCTLLHCCLSARTRECVCAHAPPCGLACACMRLFGCARLCGCVGAHLRAQACVRACLSVFICVCAHSRAHAQLCYPGVHYSGVLSSCSAGTCGISRVLGAYLRGTRWRTLAYSYSWGVLWRTRQGTQDPVEGYSRRTHTHGVYSGIRRAHTCTLANTRADHRRAGRCAVGYELL